MPPTEVRVNIADIVLALRFREHQVADTVKKRLEGFVTSAEPTGVIDVDWVVLGACDLPGDGQLAVPPGHIVDRRFTITWAYFHGDYNLDAGAGSCTVKGWFGLQKFLWVLMTVLLPERDGLVLHASSVADGARAFLFPAPSGTGKSTLVRNSPDMTVLSDEGTLVRFIEGKLQAYGSPFRSDEFRDFEYRRIPVHGIYFLKQAPSDQLWPLPGAQALQPLLAETFFSCADPPTCLGGFRVALRILQSTSAFVLELTNGPSFWRCIRAEVDRQARAGVQAVGE